MSNINVSIKPKKTVVASVQFGQRPHLALRDLTDVDASDPDDGEVIVYDAATHSYVVKPIVVEANNITSIRGGTF